MVISLKSVARVPVLVMNSQEIVGLKLVYQIHPGSSMLFHLGMELAERILPGELCRP